MDKILTSENEFDTKFMTWRSIRLGKENYKLYNDIIEFCDRFEIQCVYTEYRNQNNSPVWSFAVYCNNMDFNRILDIVTKVSK